MNLVEFTIKKMGPKKILSDKEEFEKAVNSGKRGFEYNIPDSRFNSKIVKENINGSDVIHYINPESDKIIIYIHGGGYVKESNIFQYNFVNQLAKNNHDVYFPIYPLAPTYTYKNTYEMLLILYKQILTKNKKIILIGDSAGGGLALGFTQYLKELEIKLPYKLILISPWVDISMTNPELEKYEKIDPMLSIYGLKEIGKAWAKDLDVKDYKVSPIYGNLKNLPSTIVYTGTRELLYPDICLLYDKLKENNVECELIIGEEMNHIYPLFPTTNGKKTREQILEFLKN